jgi:hypothetical protein
VTTNLTSALRISSSWTYLSTDELSLVTRDRNTKSYSQDLEDGTASEQANFVWRDRRVVTSATTTDDIDLSAITDTFGNAISALKIKELMIVNLSTTAGQNLTIGGAASGAISTLFAGSQTAQETVHAGGCTVKSSPISGFTLIPGSEDTLRITHAGAAGDIEYDIVVKGTH